MFDTITKDDLIVAFYPCIYFCEKSQCAFYINMYNYRGLSELERIKKILERTELRKEFYSRLIRFVYVIIKKGLRMIFENPWTQPHYLKGNFLKKPDVIDNNRMERGDFFIKPTAYWFWNCSPTHGFTYQNDKKQKIVSDSKSAPKAGLCSEERSMISSDYARNWICDFVLGKEQNIGQMSFDFGA